MYNIESYLKTQYRLTQESRAIVFGYCKDISAEDFVNENNSFGLGGSIRNLLVHVANAYEYWILNNALNNKISNTPYSSVTTASELESVYQTIDDGVLEFINRYKSTAFEAMNLN